MHYFGFFFFNCISLREDLIFVNLVIVFNFFLKSTSIFNYYKIIYIFFVTGKKVIFRLSCLKKVITQMH